MPLMAIDLGYSSHSASCSIMHEGLRVPLTVHFGECIDVSVERIRRCGDLILVIEGVLSTYHNPQGDPEIRGAFERGMGWYYGPGAVTYAAALRFLTQLHRRIRTRATVYLAEAFVSFKKQRISHADDALLIYRNFHRVPVERLVPGTQPILKIIEGVPPVRVFRR